MDSDIIQRVVAVLAVGSANHFHTLTLPVPSPVKNRPPGPTCMDRTSCFANILPLSENLHQRRKFTQTKEEREWE